MKSKVIGNQWEHLFERACHRQGIAVLRIHDGCRRIPGKIIPQKQACDWILVHDGQAAFIDTKTIGKGKVFNASSINQDQINKMRLMVEHGAIGGYIVWLREINKVLFLDLNTLFAAQARTSLGIEHGIDLGTMEESDLGQIFYGNV